MNTLEKIDKNNIPEHVAIIMDGNGRWAKKQGQERLYGHSIGVEAVRESINACLTLGIKYLTLYTFSTENWNRPKEEVDGIMNLLVQTISNELELLNNHQTGLIVIGDEDGLPDSCRDELRDAKEFLAKNNKLYLVLALNYSSRWEIKNAIKNISNKVKTGELKTEDITDEIISNQLCTVSASPSPVQYPSAWSRSQVIFYCPHSTSAPNPTSNPPSVLALYEGHPAPTSISH